MSERYYNTLEIIGDEAQIKAVKEFIRGTQDELGQKVYFDFNKVIKMPEKLRNEYEKLFGKQAKSFSDEELFLKENDELVKIQQKCIGNYTNWCHDNWHSKWKPINQTMEDESIINYTTINGRGLIVIEKLSQMFPEIIFVFITTCESPDDHIYHFKNGQIIKHIDYDIYVHTILNSNKSDKSISKSEKNIIENLFLTKNGFQKIKSWSHKKNNANESNN